MQDLDQYMIYDNNQLDTLWINMKLNRDLRELNAFINKNIVRASTTKRAQSRRKMLNKMTRVSKISSDRTYQFDFPIKLQTGKEVLKIEGYGRYNDDFVLIHSDKAYLQYCLDKINEMYSDLGIELNQNKTKICKLSSGFKFLKTKVHLTDTGRVVIRPDRKSIVRERRKLKKLKIKRIT